MGMSDWITLEQENMRLRQKLKREKINLEREEIKLRKMKVDDEIKNRERSKGDGDE